MQGEINDIESGMPTFYKYFSLQNDVNSRPFPKLISYVTHDEILGAFFDGLGWHQTKGAVPAAALMMEFFSRENSGGEKFIRIWY